MEFNLKNSFIKKYSGQKVQYAFVQHDRPNKMPIVERWNRSFQNDLERFLTSESEKRGRTYKRWIDALPMLTRNMNNESKPINWFQTSWCQRWQRGVHKK